MEPRLWIHASCEVRYRPKNMVNKEEEGGIHRLENLDEIGA